MANLPESASFDAGIYQIETTDAVIGGVNGISNLQAKALANRTTWLKQQVDALNLLKGKSIAAFSAANSYAGGDQVIYQKNIWQANTAIVPGAWNAANWTRQLGTSAEGELSSTLPVIDGVAAIGTSTAVARADHKHPTDTTRAPLASPTLTGTPTAPTATAGTNTTQLATTAFVQSQIASSFPAASETVAGKVELATAAETTTGTDNTRAVHPAGLKVELDKKAPLASPALTGIPTAPTASVGTSTTQVATTAFVNAEIANYAPTKTGGGASGSWGISVSGNAGTATKLATARTINGVAFDGTADISIAAGETDRLPLTGGTVTGRTVLRKAGQFDGRTSSVEIGATDWGQAILSFHRYGVEAGTLRLNGGFYFDSSVTSSGEVKATNLLGQGQTWQDVTSSRFVRTTYTNTTGRPIQIFVTFDPYGNDKHFQIDGIDILPRSDSGHYHVACIIPAGSTYRMATSGLAETFHWVELR